MARSRWTPVADAAHSLSARADYALRAAIELAAHDDRVPAERLAQAQDIPGHVLDTILTHQVIRAIDGQLLGVGVERPERERPASYRGAAEPLERVWIALRAHEREVLQAVTLADIVSGSIP